MILPRQWEFPPNRLCHPYSCCPAGSTSQDWHVSSRQMISCNPVITSPFHYTIYEQRLSRVIIRKLPYAAVYPIEEMSFLNLPTREVEQSGGFDCKGTSRSFYGCFKHVKYDLSSISQHIRYNQLVLSYMVAQHLTVITDTTVGSPQGLLGPAAPLFGGFPGQGWNFEGKQFRQGPDMIGQICRNRRGTLNPTMTKAADGEAQT